MKVVNMGNIADAFKFDDLPATGIVIEATPEELKLLPNLAYKDVTISEHVGNAAKMREALIKAQRVLHCAIVAEILRGDDAQEALNVVTAAISAPSRNCDVGTAEEQAERFHSFCESNKQCGDVYSCECCQLNFIEDCELAWSQMPYEEGGAK